MALGHCLPKNYEAIERLAPVSVICCYKTGTITYSNDVCVWQGKYVDDVQKY
jgi:magnesium-transporting ATPase (P-type)